MRFLPPSGSSCVRNTPRLQAHAALYKTRCILKPTRESKMEIRSNLKNMKFVYAVLCLFSSAAFAQEQPITLRVGTLLDGKGGVQHNTAIVVQNGKIREIDPAAGSGYEIGRASCRERV